MNRICWLPLIAVISIGAFEGLMATPASAGFRQLQALAGDWEGTDGHGMPAKTNFKLMVSETVVIETLAAAGMPEMVTLYSLDGDGIALVHYCPTNNQPRMRALPSLGAAKELVFIFRDAGNLPRVTDGHEHKLVIEFLDDDHIIERWTWRSGAKDTETAFHLARVKGR
jgi:hypothetical protein